MGAVFFRRNSRRQRPKTFFTMKPGFLSLPAWCGPGGGVKGAGQYDVVNGKKHHKLSDHSI